MNQTEQFDRKKTIKLLRSRNIAPTRPRVDIAAILFSKPQHVSADDLIELIRKNNIQVSRATVYNTLSAFVDGGLLKKLFISPTVLIYDSNTENHQHILNEETGEITDLHDIDSESLKELAALQLQKMDIPLKITDIQIFFKAKSTNSILQ